MRKENIYFQRCKMTKQKVFCIECKDFSIPAGVCCSDKNLKDTWCMPNGERLNTPDIINKKNDCKWFEPNKKGRKK